MLIFGMVNGHLVAFDAVLEASLGSDTELVLGGAALKQLYDARRRVAGNDDVTVSEGEAWYRSRSSSSSSCFGRRSSEARSTAFSKLYMMVDVIALS